MSQESNVCCTTSMYDIQNRCIPDEFDLFYFKTCIITHNNFLFVIRPVSQVQRVGTKIS